MFNKYYQDELVFLREMGREFADANPESARFLAEASADPDAERMVEGFAFLAAQIRQKLDDELPEVTHSLMDMFWPHYLRPVPATTVIQFDYAAKPAAELKALKRGMEIDSNPVDGTRCRFRTCYDFDMVPLEIRELELRREMPQRLRVKFECAGKPTVEKTGVTRILFHLAGEPIITRSLYLALCRYVKRIVVRRGAGDDKADKFELPAKNLRPVGFRNDEAVIEGVGASFGGFRLLQEYFAAPTKFIFVELSGLDGLAGFTGDTSFTVDFEFSRLPENMPPVSKVNLQLNCVPAVNQFSHDADPVRIEPGRTEYTIRPSGKDPRHYEVFSVDRVYGLEQGTAREVEYRPQFNVSRRGRRDEVFYHIRRAEAVLGDGTDLHMSFLDPDDQRTRPNVETMTVELTCTNGQLPTRLEAGDVCVKTPSSPIFAKYRNISRPAPSVPPPLRDDLHWRLIAHLSLNYLSLLNPDALRNVVSLYNFRARIDRQTAQAHERLLEGIDSVQSHPGMRLLEGMPVRGIEVTLGLDEDLLGGIGELYLFASVMNEFFAQYVSLNAFSRLVVKGKKHGEEFQWPARIGQRVIL